MLYYLGIADLPGEMAHSIQEMRMCEAFAKTGEEVVYLHGHTLGERGSISWRDVADHYGLETEFTIKTFRNMAGKTGPFTKLGTMSMAGPIAAYTFVQVLTGRLGCGDVIYGRNYYPLYFLTELLQLLPARSRPPVVYEFHDTIDKRFVGRFFERVDGIVCITEKLAEYTEETYGVERERLFVAPDGVNTAHYEGLSQQTARDRLGMSHNEDIVMYTGHCYEGKGVETLVQAADGLDAAVYVVGGHDDDIERVKQEAGHPENVVFTGFVEPSEIPTYQVAADVLVAPYDERGREFVSPLKLFEYMAAGKPIVASDRDVLREVLTAGENAVVFQTGDEDHLRERVETVLSEKTTAARLAQNSRESAEQYSWESRSQRILSFIGDRRAQSM